MKSTEYDAHTQACIEARKDPEVVRLVAAFEAQVARNPSDHKLWSAGRLRHATLDRLDAEKDRAWRAAAVKLGATFPPVFVRTAFGRYVAQ